VGNKRSMGKATFTRVVSREMFITLIIMVSPLNQLNKNAP
jgi:hypothetical protein